MSMKAPYFYMLATIGFIRASIGNTMQLGAAPSCENFCCVCTPLCVGRVICQAHKRNKTCLKRVCMGHVRKYTTVLPIVEYGATFH